jgi:hypothetical protein
MMRIQAVLVLAISTAALSLAGPFTNGSFESSGVYTPPANYMSYGSTFVTGWVHEVTDLGEFYTDGAAWGITAGQGTYYVGFGAFSQTGGTLSQTFDTVTGQNYVVNYLLTSQELSGPLPDQVALVEALDGSTVLGSVSNTINSPAGVWYGGLSLAFTATSGSTTLRFTDMTLLANTPLINWGLDDVTVAAVASAPEPASYALIGLGLGFIGLRKKLFRPRP